MNFLAYFQALVCCFLVLGAAAVIVYSGPESADCLALGWLLLVVVLFIEKAVWLVSDWAILLALDVERSSVSLWVQADAALSVFGCSRQQQLSGLLHSIPLIANLVEWFGPRMISRDSFGFLLLSETILRQAAVAPFLAEANVPAVCAAFGCCSAACCVDAAGN
ncbi:hypothetical protein Nepgr_030087 [Nepenthes gracilis]|uniref:Uncharacterized protein n=1 Tax=Nepenthes gracilis TaxID=150966 RepID=A0AAD3Y5Q4_NEPGR|nr:hypothetical protein Nepgr_030087 [Nepenthes gracilis]